MYFMDIKKYKVGKNRPKGWSDEETQRALGDRKREEQKAKKVGKIERRKNGEAK